jgi:membrane-bound serine protease (ClpP class)
VLTYVAPAGAHAGSAGVFITMAGHVAAMAPGTNIGAAAPVGGQGQDIEGDMATKVIEDTRAFAEAIATERDRNVKWAADAVTLAVSVEARRALELNVIDMLADNDAQFLEKAHGREVTIDGEKVRLNTAGARIVFIEMTLSQRLVSFLANPNVAYMLLTLGFLGLYFELSNPGMIFPGVIGALSLILGFVALQVLPFNAGGLALMILAIGLFVAEIFVSSFGLLSIAGIISLILGGVLLFDTPEATFNVDYGLIIAVGAALGLVFGAIALLVAKTFRRRVETGREGMLGKIGVARTDIDPEGKVFVMGELWSAKSATPISQGAKVEVIGLEGLEITVKPV